MTVKNPVNSGQSVEQVLPASDCVCSRPLARLALLSLTPHPELLKNELRVDLQRTQPVAGLQTRTWKEKGAAMRRKWVHSKMMGNHQMGHGFQGCYFCQHPRSLVLHKPTNPNKKSKERVNWGKTQGQDCLRKSLLSRMWTGSCNYKEILSNDLKLAWANGGHWLLWLFAGLLCL